MQPHLHLEEDEASLVRIFAPRIHLFGRKHLRSPEAADDLVQEVLIVVLTALRDGRVREPERLPSFVLGTCRNVAANHRRAEATRSALQARFSVDLEPQQDPERHRPDRARLGLCLTRLPQREYQVIFATFYGELSAKGIAREQATSEGNVRVIRHRALARLRRCVDGEVTP